MSKKRTVFQAEMNKNIARIEFCKAFDPKAAEKLRSILEENKAKEKRQ